MAPEEATWKMGDATGLRREALAASSALVSRLITLEAWTVQARFLGGRRGSAGQGASSLATGTGCNSAHATPDARSKGGWGHF